MRRRSCDRNGCHQDEDAKQAAYDYAIDSHSTFYTLPNTPEYRFEKVYVLAALWLYRRLGCRLDREFKGR